MTSVLVAEDEPDLLQSYCELIRAAGHDCIPASDGQHALELARAHHPSLVITDCMMPRRSGLELLHAMRGDPHLRDVPVILLSAGKPPETDRLRSGDTLFLAKPVSIDALERAVARFVHSDGPPTDRYSRGEALKAGTGPCGGDAAPPSLPATNSGHALSAMRDEMLGWVSHQIRSPLSAAMSACQLASRGLERGEHAHATDRRLGVIMRQLDRINDLVVSVLDAAQLSEGKIVLVAERVDLGPLLSDAVASWKGTHPTWPLSARIEARSVVRGDASRLRQIVDILLSNAFQHGRLPNRPGVTSILLRADGKDDVIAVTDDGPGLPEGDVDRVFTRFYRPSGDGGRGHGLGLYIAAELARLHGGTIRCESRPGRGSTFIVRLPSASSAAPS